MIYRRSPSIATTRVADEFLLAPVSGDLADMRQLFALNETGQTVWNALADGADENRIATAVIAEFDVEEAVARQDVRELLARLVERGLVETEQKTSAIGMKKNA